jgi:hypothetical protein
MWFAEAVNEDNDNNYVYVSFESPSDDLSKAKVRLDPSSE